MTSPDETQPPANSEPTSPAHQGHTISDATVVEQAIRFPTYLSLLNEAREFSEQIIDILCAHLKVDQNPELIVRRRVQPIMRTEIRTGDRYGGSRGLGT